MGFAFLPKEGPARRIVQGLYAQLVLVAIVRIAGIVYVMLRS